jgi:hypothetical protein
MSRKKKKEEKEAEAGKMVWLHEGLVKPENASGYMWLFFSFDQLIDAIHAQCQLCGELVAYGSEHGSRNPSSLVGHLSGRNTTSFSMLVYLSSKL